MGESLFRAINKKQRELVDNSNWFQCVPAIVAENEDPEHQHRIKVVIPLIDENLVHDEWIRQMGGFAGSGGYGNFDIPKIGAPVVLFSEFGQGENIYYQCVYNEVNRTPGDFEDETVRGVRSDGDYKIITRGDLILIGGRIIIQSEFGTVQISSAAGIIFEPEKD